MRRAALLLLAAVALAPALAPSAPAASTPAGSSAAAEIVPALTGELVDGRYEDEQVHEHPPPLQGSATVHTLIEQKGQENAGAPVG
jgi:hypothetical protein